MSDQRDHAEETANAAIMAGERRKITQCEGCFEPLGPLLEQGWTMEEFEITWQLCLSHDRYVNGGGSDV